MEIAILIAAVVGILTMAVFMEVDKRRMIRTYIRMLQEENIKKVSSKTTEVK